jgi:hypothetical protein
MELICCIRLQPWQQGTFLAINFGFSNGDQFQGIHKACKLLIANHQ